MGRPALVFLGKEVSPQLSLLCLGVSWQPQGFPCRQMLGLLNLQPVLPQPSYGSSFGG